MSFDNRIREALDHATAALRAQLDRDFSTLAAELTRFAAEERERAARASAEIDTLKRAVAEERERVAQQAAESAANDMRRQAETQAHIAQLHDDTRRRIDELQRLAADERERAVREAVEAAVAEARRDASAQLAQLRREADARLAEAHSEGEEQLASAQRTAEEQLAAARRDADVQLGKLRESLQAQADEIRRTSDARIEELRATLQAQIDEARHAAQAAQVETEDARRAAQAAQAETEEARRAAQAAQTETEEARRTANVEIDDARRMAASQVDDVQRRAEEQVDEARREIELQGEEARRRARADVESIRVELERVRTEAEASARAARAEAEDVVIAQLASAQAEAEKKIEDAVERTRTDASQAELARTSRLLAAVRRLDEARSLGELLDTLAEGAQRHVDRAAVLIVRNKVLRVLRLAGLSGERPSGDLDLDAAGIAGTVVRTGASATRAAEDAPHDAGDAALPPFAQGAGARQAVALPIVVGGQVVAVLYGDAARSDSASATSRWPATLEVLARHASRALEALTIQRAVGLKPPSLGVPKPPPRTTLPGPVEHGGVGDDDAARRYARLLVSEIRMYHEPVVDAGRRSRDLRSRLGGEIDRARRLYEQRVPQAVRERSDYFEQELIRTLADGDRSLLG